MKLGVQPKFVDPRKNFYIAKVGERVDLDCSVRPNVYPSAWVEWQKQDGDVLTTIPRMGENFTIENATLNDSGTYFCKVTNDLNNRLASQLKQLVLDVYGEQVYQ